MHMSARADSRGTPPLQNENLVEEYPLEEPAFGETHVKLQLAPLQQGKSLPPSIRIATYFKQPSLKSFFEGTALGSP